jgi:hypothetical protein
MRATSARGLQSMGVLARSTDCPDIDDDELIGDGTAAE